MKIKLFTHTDLDGVGCAIVAKHVYENIDIEYLNYDEVDYTVSKFIDKESSKYDRVYITDISVNEEVARKIDEFIPKKIKLLDHHATAKWLNKYQWATVNPLHEDGTKSSGTTMLFDYLSQPTELSEFVEKVRRYDTWDWATIYNDNHAKELNDLLYLVGRESFVERFINNPSIIFSEGEKLILKVEQNQIDNYINNQKDKVKKVNILGYNAGLVFAEKYSSLLGNVLAKENPELDFIVMIDLANSKISYRGIHDHIDLGSDVAKVFGGGGHAKAAGSQIEDDIKDKIVNLIFN